MFTQHERSLMHILRQQFIVGIIGALTLTVLGYVLFATSFFCGVSMMMANGWWLAGRLEKTNGLGVGEAQRSLYVCAAIRFMSLIAVLLLAYAIGFHLLLVASGMFVAQAVIFVSAVVSFKREQK